MEKNMSEFEQVANWLRICTNLDADCEACPFKEETHCTGKLMERAADGLLNLEKERVLADANYASLHERFETRVKENYVLTKMVDGLMKQNKNLHDDNVRLCKENSFHQATCDTLQDVLSEHLMAERDKEVLIGTDHIKNPHGAVGDAPRGCAQGGTKMKLSKDNRNECCYDSNNECANRNHSVNPKEPPLFVYPSLLTIVAFGVACFSFGLSIAALIFKFVVLPG